MTVFASLASIARGLASRTASSLMILAVAIVAVAAATAGPTYFGAAKTSILHDTVTSVPVLGRAYSVQESGPISSTISSLSTDVADAFPRANPLYQPPIEAIEGTLFATELEETIPLVWRSDECAHLQIEGTCPSGSSQIIVSRSLANTNHWQRGQRLTFPGWPVFTVSGIYDPPGMTTDFWFDRFDTYFSFENPPAQGARAPTPMLDAVFVQQSTLDRAPPSAQGNSVVTAVLKTSQLPASQLGTLSAGIAALNADQALVDENAVVTSDIPQTLTMVHSSWSSLEVPVFLVTVQLLGLAWLLLFLLVTEAVAARGPEIALAKLRGYERWRVAVFALSEPVALLAVALPIGALVGWGVSSLLGTSQLRNGTPVGLPGLGWAAAAAGVAGGVVAVVVASRGTLRRPIAEQWRRASTAATQRTWVVDAVLLTGAVIGLGELEITGKISSASHSAVSLLVPGLLGLAVAVVASRLLPLACRWLASSRRAGGLAAFLALRHVARRPNGTRTTIILATSFALATFAISAWLVNAHNYRVVADSQVGAPTILTVTTPLGADLGALVAQADPSGRQAAAVESESSNEMQVLAVDPEPWIHVIDRQAAGLHATPSNLVAALAPPAPAPLILDGDEVSLTVVVGQLSPPGTSLSMDVAVSGGTDSSPVYLGTVPVSGSITFRAGLVDCPCTVESIEAQPPPALNGNDALQGTLTLRSLAVRRGGQMLAIGPGFSDPSHWRPGNDNASSQSVRSSNGDLQWKFDVPGRDNASLVAVDRPTALPAIAAAALTGKKTGPFTAIGLAGTPLAVNVIATAAAVPGAPADGVVVDRRFAELAADGNLSQIAEQVWLGKGAPDSIATNLQREGVAIAGTQRQGDQGAALRRQGPGLASALFLAEGGAAALLAAGGALVGLYLSARRRRYELAALMATGLLRRTLLGAVAAEQLLVLAFGIVVGVATGLVAAALALRDVPAFITQPAAPALTYSPAAATLAGIVAIAMVAVLAVALLGCVTLVRGVRLDQLREAPA